MFVRWLLGCATDGGVEWPADQAELERHTFEWADPSRDTPALGDLPAAPERVLHTWVWVGPGPGSSAGERPLLIVAHGVDGHPDKFEAFASSLALDGVVVAAPAFPASNRDSGAGGVALVDLPEQPADLRFVLGRLLDDVADPASPLWGRFDPARVAVLGHSLGGATLLGLSRFDSEPRIGAQLYLSPATLLTTAFDGELDPSGPPTLLMHGLEDPLLPPALSTELFDQIDDPRWYLGIAGAYHSDPIESQDEPPIPARAAAQSAVRAMIRAVFEREPWAVGETLDGLAADGHTVLP